MTTSHAVTGTTHGAGYASSVGLVTLNSKYVHMALAPRYMREAAREAGFADVWLREFTIHTPLWRMAEAIMARCPAVLGFSVYIWNREETLALIELLKKQDPALYVVVGGPEVSFEEAPPPHVDAVIAGEGEAKWVEALGLWARGERPDAATLRRWATHGTDLPPLPPPPFTEADLAHVGERLVYVETSRGCPYSCSFCLSALDEQVRFVPDEQVKATIERLVGAGARRIKFLDRTFNLRRGRVRDFFAWLSRFEGVQFHFEIVGDLLDEATLELLDTVTPGMFQFEVGVQSADLEVNRRVSRRQKTERLFAMLRRLRDAGRVKIHADLIWGLPGETPAQIRDSFEQVVALRPHELQLGFLKFLPGAPIRHVAAQYDYAFQERPPYELIRHRDLAAHEVLRLKRFEEVFDTFYNSGHFRFTLERLFGALGAWETVERLADYHAAHDLLLQSHSLEARLHHLLDAMCDVLPEYELRDLLKLDYFYHHRARRVPAFLHDGEAVEAPRVRALRKAEPDTAVVPFMHRIALHNGTARLEPVSEAMWYAFAYPRRPDGYFFTPHVRAV